MTAKGKTNINSHAVNIPPVYDNFPDGFLLDSRDVMQIMGYKSLKSLSCWRNGVIPAPVNKNFRSFSGGAKALFLLGDFRRLKKLREMGLSYCGANLEKIEIEAETGLKK